MKDLKCYLYIPDLIVKNLRGGISEEERFILEQWLNEREENRLLYEKICNQKDTEPRDRIINKLHKTSAWQRVNRETRGKKIWMRPGFRYVAAAVVVLVISSIFFIMYQLPARSSLESSLCSTIKINPGGIKAELILADGQHLPLDGDKGHSIL